ncbi:MAG: hypothetical protein F2817_17415 [Actinobacteria bacterium]|nr:hypothetical protein [Actinomycetota bacterium]
MFISSYEWRSQVMDYLGSTGMLPELTDREIAYGFPIGMSDSSIQENSPPMRRGPSDHPIQVLDTILLNALTKSPCVITFSGGRDSSLLLARAAMVAKKHGLPGPVALTHRYPAEDVDAQETVWQHRVVDHLRLLDLPVEWIINDVTTEFDILGKPLTDLLTMNGRPFFPPASGASLFDYQFAAGGSLVTGEFGDELFANSRSYRFRRSISELKYSGRTSMRRVVRPLFPSMRSIGAEEIAMLTGITWLTEDALHGLFASVKQAADDDFGWKSEVRRKLKTRAVQVSLETRDRIAGLFDCIPVDPFLDFQFIDSWFGHIDYFGISRSQSMRLLSDGMLPDSVIDRESKAFFNRSRFGEDTKSFAAKWDGAGIESPDVDVSRLRDAWMQNLVTLQSAMLLQQAWLSDGHNSVR